MLTFSAQLFTSGDMSDDLTSAPQQMTNMLYMSIQCVWTDGTGVLTVQACNDPKITSASVWSDLVVGTSITLNGSQPAGTSSNCMFNNNATGVPWGWIRLVYTQASGSGLLNATIFAKGA